MNSPRRPGPSRPHVSTAAATDVSLTASGFAVSDADWSSLMVAAQDRLVELLAIAGPSGQEGEVVKYTTDKLRDWGIRGTQWRTDGAHRRTAMAGQVGNLILRLAGRRELGARRLL